MTAKSMQEKGEKTTAKILAALGKKAKTPLHIGTRAKVSADYARARLVELEQAGKAERVKQGRKVLYRLPAQAGAVS